MPLEAKRTLKMSGGACITALKWKSFWAFYSRSEVGVLPQRAIWYKYPPQAKIQLYGPSFLMVLVFVNSDM